VGGGEVVLFTRKFGVIQVRFRSDRLFESEEQAQARKQKARDHQQELELQIDEKRKQKATPVPRNSITHVL
jgi:hypothetical protein